MRWAVRCVTCLITQMARFLRPFLRTVGNSCPDALCIQVIAFSWNRGIWLFWNGISLSQGLHQVSRNNHSMATKFKTSYYPVCDCSGKLYRENLGVWPCKKTSPSGTSILPICPAFQALSVHWLDQVPCMISCLLASQASRDSKVFSISSFCASVTLTSLPEILTRYFPAFP